MTTPRRRGPHPVLVLCLLALVPALVLGGVWSLARSRAPGPPPPPTPVGVAPSVEAPTAVLSFRRTPATVSREVSLDDLARELAPLVDLVGDGSCLSVAVDGLRVVEDNPSTAVLPASTQKLLTGAAALEVLGADFRFVTEVRGVLDATGTVNGDLYLVGGGDPLLAADWYPESALVKYPQQPATSLDSLADAVVAAGVRVVNGNVVGDAGRYDDERFPPTWSEDVRVVEGGPLGALMVNDAVVRDDPLKAAIPAEGAAREFVRLLRERGVAVTRGSTVGVAPAEATTIASVESAPLGEIVGELLSASDNNTAELLVKELGLVATGIGTREAGLQVVRDTLASWGVPLDGVVLADGSGLSRDNRITCAVLQAVLQRHGPDDPIGRGLAVAGRSGTLAEVFLDDPLEGRLLGKTGTLRDVKALAGYVPERPEDGPSVIQLALVLNAPGIDQQVGYRPIWEGLLSDALASFPAGPSTSQLAPAPVVRSRAADASTTTTVGG